MAPRNDFQLFAGGAGANTMAAAAYAADARRLLGVQAGTASSQLANTSWRQTSMIAAMVGMFINARGGVDANDDGNVAALEASFELALRQLGSVATDQVRQAIQAANIAYNASDPSQLADALGRGIFLGPVGGSADALIGVIPQGQFLLTVPAWTRFRCQSSQTNATTTPTFTLTNIGALGQSIQGTMVREDGTPLVAGDIPTNKPYTLQLDANGNFRFAQSVASDAPNAGTSTTILTNNRVPTNFRQFTNSTRTPVSGSGAAMVNALTFPGYSKIGAAGSTDLLIISQIISYGGQNYTGAGPVAIAMSDGAGHSDTKGYSGDIYLSGVGAISVKNTSIFKVSGIPAGALTVTASVGGQQAGINWQTIVNPDSVDYGGSGSHTGVGATSTLTLMEIPT